MGDGEGIMSFTHFESTFFYWSEPLQSAQRIKESKKKNQRIVYLQKYTINILNIMLPPTPVGVGNCG